MYNDNTADFFYDHSNQDSGATEIDIGASSSFAQDHSASTHAACFTSASSSCQTSRRASKSGGFSLALPPPPSGNGFIINPYIDSKEHRSFSDSESQFSSIGDHSLIDPSSSLPPANLNPYISNDETYTLAEDTFSLDQERPTPSPGPLPEFFTRDTELLNASALGHMPSLSFPSLLAGSFHPFRRASTGNLVVPSIHGTDSNMSTLLMSQTGPLLPLRDGSSMHGGMVGAVNDTPEDVEMSRALSSSMSFSDALALPQKSSSSTTGKVSKSRKSTTGTTTSRRSKKPPPTATQTEARGSSSTSGSPQIRAKGADNLDSSKPKRHQVKVACTNCREACKKCSHCRPCERCVMYGIADSCFDLPRKKRALGIKRGSYKGSVMSKMTTPVNSIEEEVLAKVATPSEHDLSNVENVMLLPPFTLPPLDDYKVLTPMDRANLNNASSSHSSTENMTTSMTVNEMSGFSAPLIDSLKQTLAEIAPAAEESGFCDGFYTDQLNAASSTSVFDSSVLSDL